MSSSYADMPFLASIKEEPDWMLIANTPKNYVLHFTLKEAELAETKGLNAFADEKFKPLKVDVVGCHGKINMQANLVAAALKSGTGDIRASPGDNIYKIGASKGPTDPKFDELFHDKFDKKPTLLALGNHDEGIQKIGGLSGDDAIKRASHQVAHTYYTENKFDQKKFDYLDKKTHIDLETLNKLGFHWIMPSRYYSIDCPSSNTTFYVCDSNTFMNDLRKLKKINQELIDLEKKIDQDKNELKKIKEGDGSLNANEILRYENLIAASKQQYQKWLDERMRNQVYWFHNAIKKNPHRRNVVMQHHPIHAFGTRSKASDASNHLTEAENNEVLEILKIKNGCDLVVGDLPADGHFAQLIGQCRAAYVWTKDKKLFFIDKINNICTPVPLKEEDSKEFEIKCEINQTTQVDYFETLSSEKLATISKITGSNLHKKDIYVNYNDMLRMEWAGNNILPLVHLVINAHEHHTCLYNHAQFNEAGKKIKDSYCQLTAGGGGGTHEAMEDFSRRFNTPHCSGYGPVGIKFKDKNITHFKIRSINSHVPAETHSRGKTWLFSNESLEPILDWKNISSEDEKESYLSIRKILLNACHEYFEMAEKKRSPDQSEEKYTSYMFRMFKESTKKIYNLDEQGINRCWAIIGTINDPEPKPILEMLKEVSTLIIGSTDLLELINHHLKKSPIKNGQDTIQASDLTDLAKKYAKAECQVLGQVICYTNGT